MVAQILGAVDVVSWLALVAMSLLSPDGDLGLKTVNIHLAWLITALFLLTGAPALCLALLRRFPKLALGLGGAFPVLFIVIYGALTVAAG